MYITELSIKRPVVAVDFSMILVVFGLFVWSIYTTLSPITSGCNPFFPISIYPFDNFLSGISYSVFINGLSSISGFLLQIGVFIGPGSIRTTSTSCISSSLLNESVRPSNANLDAVYGPTNGYDLYPLIDPIFIILFFKG